ncbi:hypothetical protein Molly5_51 [Maribacter phage Molly_5]|uniref:Uncharacterized protein n=2 Tax=Mollyvirus TaxID=2948826 RepID=A0A8E4XY09_9CAUD|nr:hypothetical protein M1M29_gp051 [Maribacter phage Molly_1]YP_010357298.1 hypothetical protein M1M30_gp049 [Maribacter phage Colly_1]QQO97735.1 hypothetical protein Molly2_51 [Maribacter phage Molly_2]QQO97935.1 hypothetical protein Molly3_51 [Maribacter phage Molly_3]QQO98135.1 hypothetical protein Molly4_51 [Maribacter phage Molly_4]QQO98335.1 hypothetical protein Molly5_51 [Maribacter phage Molly_5]QQO97332.1 hypothetical protein Colly1_49 [Maribacter phage Colly_1]
MKDTSVYWFTWNISDQAKLLMQLSFKYIDGYTGVFLTDDTKPKMRGLRMTSPEYTLLIAEYIKYSELLFKEFTIRKIHLNNLFSDFLNEHKLYTENVYEQTSLNINKKIPKLDGK